jgi:hypothetical protein
VDEIPEHLRRDLSFVFVDTVTEVLESALESPASKNGRAPRGRRGQAPRAGSRARV